MESEPLKQQKWMVNEGRWSLWSFTVGPFVCLWTKIREGSGLPGPQQQLSSWQGRLSLVPQSTYFWCLCWVSVPQFQFPTFLFTQEHNKWYHYTFLLNIICFNLCCIPMLETLSVCLFSWEEFQSWEVEHLKLQTQTSFASERKGQCFLQLNTSDRVPGAEIQLAQIPCSNEVTLL